MFEYDTFIHISPAFSTEKNVDIFLCYISAPFSNIYLHALPLYPLQLGPVFLDLQVLPITTPSITKLTCNSKLVIFKVATQLAEI